MQVMQPVIDSTDSIVKQYQTEIDSIVGIFLSTIKLLTVENNQLLHITIQQWENVETKP